MGFDIKFDTDFSALIRLEKAVKQLNSRHIRWGWLKDIKHPTKDGKRSGISVAQIANWQEYGTDKIPARPYFRQAINKSRYSYNSDIADIFKSSLNGLVDHIKLNALADNLVKDYHESVVKQNYKKLAEYTVSIKGHTYQMDHTGLMLTSFEAKVYKQSIDAVKEPYVGSGGK